MTRRANARNASVQVWQAYLNNRASRLRDNRFLVHGMRPIAQALECRWPLETLVYRLGGPEPSAWAREVLDSSGVPSVGLVPEVMSELAEPSQQVPELVAVAIARRMELEDFAPGTPDHPPNVVVIDRPASPARLGGLIRSAAAFGAGGVIITGTGADHYDPRSVQASDGALFAVPVLRASDPRRCSHSGTGSAAAVSPPVSSAVTITAESPSTSSNSTAGPCWSSAMKARRSALPGSRRATSWCAFRPTARSVRRRRRRWPCTKFPGSAGRCGENFGSGCGRRCG